MIDARGRGERSEDLSGKTRPTMAARSIAELLPRPFDELELEDVAEILRRVGEDRESLYFERKRSVTPSSLAKTCAAFANTNGGLLVVGVEDGSDELVGVESVGSEPQVWVKDVLRGRVLPLPAFQARALDVGNGLVLLLVLVEWSSTTPHLLTRSGAIYVRNPGSSDPVPIGDQGLLLDLTRRGRDARDAAVSQALELVQLRWNEHDLFTLVLAPTGAASDAVRSLYRSGRVEILETATQLHDVTRDHRPEWWTLEPEWSLHRVRRQREVRRHISDPDPNAFVDGVVVTSECIVQLQRSLVSREHGVDPEPRGPGPLELEGRDGIAEWFAEGLRRGREVILELGGHGDLFIVFRVRSSGRHVFWASSRAEEADADLLFTYWWALDSDRDGELIETLRQDVRRGLGVRA